MSFSHPTLNAIRKKSQWGCKEELAVISSYSHGVLDGRCHEVWRWRHEMLIWDDCPLSPFIALSTHISSPRACCDNLHYFMMDHLPRAEAPELQKPLMFQFYLVYLFVTVSLQLFKRAPLSMQHPHAMVTSSCDKMCRLIFLNSASDRHIKMIATKKQRNVPKCTAWPHRWSH